MQLTAQEITNVLVIILLLVLICGVTVLVYRLNATLGTLNDILEDTKGVTGKISKVSENPEMFGSEVGSYVSASISKFVQRQVDQSRLYLSRTILSGALRFLKGD